MAYAELTVPGIIDIPDLHGTIVDPDLVIFFGGNQFMVLPELMASFQEYHPEVRRIFYETLPPGIIEQQLKTGTLIVGDLNITIQADLFIGGDKRVQSLEHDGFLLQSRPYFRNKLTIMTVRGNPKNILTLQDLARKDVYISMPDPETEGIAAKIETALKNAGGDDLFQAVMIKKREDHSAFITRIHHRQTPMRIMSGQSDAGLVWLTEGWYAKMIGNPIETIEIPDHHNASGTTSAAIVRNAAHPEQAGDFFDFITGDAAAAIYSRYGFTPIR